MPNFGMGAWPWALLEDGKYHAYSTGLDGKNRQYAEVTAALQGNDPNDVVHARFGTPCGLDVDYLGAGLLRYKGFKKIERRSGATTVPKKERRCKKCTRKTMAKRRS